MVTTTSIITVAIVKMVNPFQRNTITAAMLSVLLLVMVFAVNTFQRDWQFFSIEKQLSTWGGDLPPSLEEVGSISERMQPLVAYNPNMMRMHALTLEWKALLDTKNQRFHLYGAEESLQHAVVLRPTDSRAWAHLALIKSKLYREARDIQFCYEKAKQLGVGDRQTLAILKRVLTG